MKRGGGFLFIFCAAVLAGWLWVQLQTSFGAPKVMLTDPDGHKYEVEAGPKASWPAWAIIPPDVTLIVNSRHGRTPAQAATGHGHIEGPRPPLETIATYRSSLEAADWLVETVPYQMPGKFEPGITGRGCMIRAARPAPEHRVVLVYFSLDAPDTSGGISWADGLPQTLPGLDRAARAEPGTC